MSFEPGGRADKLGNRYEDRWVVKQFFRIINEEVASLTLEPIGDEEVGVEFWIKLKDGRKEGHQCKARNADKEKWTISDYKNKNILSKALHHLDRDPSCIYSIVSAVPNTLLGDICDTARNSNENPSDFYKYQIKNRGASVKSTFNDFCTSTGLDTSKDDDIRRAYDYLKRIRIILFPDNEVTKEDLLREASFLFTNKPETVYSHLVKYAVENNKLGSPITANDLISYLERQNIILKLLSHNKKTLPVIQRLQGEFKSTIQPNLIKGELIKRRETSDCLDYLDEDGLVMITGDSGVGKSGVLYELTQKFDEDEVLYIPLKVDRQLPKNNAAFYGEELGFPDSPVFSLAGIVDTQPAVIITDQLDAIRWTGAHSTNALNVCKELINQVLFLKRQGKNIKLVLSCRSFDLRYDPELKNWFENKIDTKEYRWETIEIKPLSDNSLKEAIGDTFSSLSSKQRTLLAHPQNLFMWLEISIDNDFTFTSSIDLMREFWTKKRLKIEQEGVNVTDLNNTIDKLTFYMENNSVISAPSRIVQRCSQVALNSLKSHTIIREQNRTISFSHQSYLDFLIAERVVESIEAGKSILEWIGTRDNQTLFRREQLRQALNMLIQENYYNFAGLAKDILFSKSVRFHLKHLVLEVIGHTNEFDTQTEKLIFELVRDNYWGNYVLETIILGNSNGINILIREGLLQQWLLSENETEANIAASLLGSCKNGIPDELIGVLRKLYEGNEVMKNRLLGIIGWDVEKDTDNIFDLRIKLAENKKYSYYANWAVMSKKHPLRVIRYIEAILKSIDNNKTFKNKDGRNRVEDWYKDDLNALLSISEEFCFEVWDTLVPQLMRLCPQLDNEKLNRRNYRAQFSIIEGTIRMIINAGRTIAKEYSSQYIERANLILETPYNTLKNLVFESLSYLSSDNADYGIEVFMNHADSLLDMDRSSLNESKYVITRKIIESLTPFCNKETFNALEEFIFGYHESDELRLAEWSLEYRRDGYYHSFYWGEVQYLLLSKLDSNRISNKTSALLKVLKRRYKGKSDEEIVNQKNWGGGIIGSKLDRNLFNISDKSWLGIIHNKKLELDRSKIWEQNKSGEFVESSVFQFSSSLEKAAKLDPERFGLLSLKFSSNISPSYITAILRALSLQENEINSGENTWWPASKNTIIRVLEKHLNIHDKEISMAFCRLIKSREDIDWPEHIIENLKLICTCHQDPEVGKLNMYRTEWDGNFKTLTTRELFDNSINCVRGVAVEAIGSLLWSKPDLLNVLEGTIEKVTNDPHPSVRISVIGMLLPVINIDKEKAVKWFIKNTKDDLRVISEVYAIPFMNYTIKENHDLLGAVLERMLNSEYDEVVILGSRMITAYNIILNVFNDKVNKCLNGSTAQKKGVIKSANELISNEEYSERCLEILDLFIGNYDEMVAEEMNGVFQYDFNDLKKIEAYVIRYIKSPYFNDNSNLIYKLIDYKHTLIDFSDVILSLGYEVSERFADKTRDNTSRLRMLAIDLPKLLLRLYDESLKKNDKDILNQCLDLWDDFFEKRIGTVKELTEAIDI